jgi:ribosomal protein S18 acetylase RimI-like enzyme
MVDPPSPSNSSALEPIPVTAGRGTICRTVLESLPEWFGIPAALERYVSAADALPMLACFDPAGSTVAFVSIKTLSPFAAEVHVLGVKRSWHRQGIGRRLVDAASRLAVSQGARDLTAPRVSGCWLP